MLVTITDKINAENGSSAADSLSREVLRNVSAYYLLPITVVLKVGGKLAEIYDDVEGGEEGGRGYDVGEKLIGT